MLGHLEIGRAEGDGRVHDAIDIAAQDALEGTGHADVALEGRAAGKDLFVGGRHVRVGAQHGGDASVEVASHELLLAGRLGVEVEHADDGTGRASPAEPGRHGSKGSPPAA